MAVRLRPALATAALVLSFSGITLAGVVGPPVGRLDEQAIPMEQLLKNVGSFLGQRLVAAPSVADGKIAAVLVVTEADKFRGTLDRLPGYQWVEVTGADGTEFHVLAPDWDELEVWKRLQDTDKANKEKQRLEGYKKRLSEAFHALSLSDDELSARIDDDPNLVSALSGAGSRGIIEHLAGLPAEKLDLVFQPRGLTCGIRDLSAATQDALLQVLHRWMSEHPEGFGKVEDEDRKFLEEGTVGIGWGEGLEYGIALGEEASGGGSVLNPRTLYAESARTGLRIRRGMSENEAGTYRDKDMETWRQKRVEEEKALREERLRDTPPRFGSDRLPDSRLKSLIAEGSAYTAFREICAQAGLGIVCQYFDRYEKTRVPELGEGTPTADALDEAADGVGDVWNGRGYVWAFSDGQVLLTSRFLVEDLQRLIPTPALEKWRQRAAIHGGRLTLADLAEMAVSNLTPEQLSNMPFDLKKVGAFDVAFFRQDLRFYASLSAEQRVATLAEAGLAYAELSSEQKALFDKAALRERETLGPGAPVMDSFGIRTNQFGDVDFVYSFSDREPAVHHTSIRMPETTVGKQDAGSKAADPTSSTPPDPVLRAALALAEWTYVDSKDRGRGPRASVRRGMGDRSDTQTLAIGDELEGAYLTDVSPKYVTFTIDRAQIRLPISRLVSLQPFAAKRE